MLTEKKAAFARAYVETGNASKAYRMSYDAAKMSATTIKKRASELLRDRDVAGTIADLKQDLQERHVITADSLAGELEEARRLAIKEANPAAAVSATMGKARLFGLENLRHELTGRDGADLLPKMDPAEVIRRALMAIREAAEARNNPNQPSERTEE